MVSKPKSRTFIVLHRGRSHHGGFTVLGRYQVGARNEQEAEALVRTVVGKHAKVKVYFEDKTKKVQHGVVIEERRLHPKD